MAGLAIALLVLSIILVFNDMQKGKQKEKELAEKIRKIEEGEY